MNLHYYQLEKEVQIMSNENKNIYSNWLHFKNTLPDEYFIDKIEKNRKIRPEVCLVILREVLDPVLVRNSDPERAELFIATGSSGKEIVRARINGEKFTSVERLTGLNLCRILNNINNEDCTIIAPSNSYNEPLGGLA